MASATGRKKPRIVDQGQSKKLVGLSHKRGLRYIVAFLRSMCKTLGLMSNRVWACAPHLEMS